MLEGGGPKHFGIVVTQALEVIAMMKGAANAFTLSQWGGGRNKFRNHDFHIFWPTSL